MPFLDGRYQRAEQVIDGAMQTFRGRDVKTGASVFLHRIPNTQGPEQTGLLRLLLSSVIRSAAVKQFVIDFREEGEICYVVTQSVPQCLLLREWLQFEFDRTRSEQDASAAAPAQNQAGSAGASVNRTAESGPPGEFTRLFSGLPPLPAQPGSSPKAAPVRSIQPVPPAPGKFEDSDGGLKPHEFSSEPSSVSVPAKAAPGEFTRFFASFPEAAPEGSEPKIDDSPLGGVLGYSPDSGSPILASNEAKPLFCSSQLADVLAPRPEDSVSFEAPTRKQDAVSEAHEFTSFLDDSDLSQPRLGDVQSGVQRPTHAAAPFNPTPVNPSPKVPRSPGEFTRMFSGVSEPDHPAAISDAMRSGGYTGIFFGTATPEAVLSPIPNQDRADALLDSGKLAAPGGNPVPAPAGPSEFTRVVQGLGAEEKASPDGVPAVQQLVAAAPITAAAVAPPPLPTQPQAAAIMRKHGNRTLLLVLLGLLAAAVLLLVFAVLKN